MSYTVPFIAVYIPVSAGANHDSSSRVYTGPFRSVNSLLLSLPHLDCANSFFIRGEYSQIQFLWSEHTKFPGSDSAMTFSSFSLMPPSVSKGRPRRCQ